MDITASDYILNMFTAEVILTACHLIYDRLTGRSGSPKSILICQNIIYFLKINQAKSVGFLVLKVVKWIPS